MAEKTIAANVLAHGTGALNVDACRVAGTARQFDNGTRRSAGIMGQSEPRGLWEPDSPGRWPPNLLLSHSPGCVQTGTRQVRGTHPVQPGGGKRNDEHSRPGQVYGSFPPGARFDYTGPDGLETVPAWQCEESCPVRELDRQSGFLRPGERPATAGITRPKEGSGVALGGNWKGIERAKREVVDAGGGASRFFPQFAHDPVYDAPFLYQAKASTRERNQGLGGDAGVARNSHPT